MGLNNLLPDEDKHLFVSVQKESEDLKKRFFELYILYRLSKHFNYSIHLEDFYENGLKYLNELLSIHEFNLLLLDDVAKGLKVKIWKSYDTSQEEMKDKVFKIDEGVTGTAVQTGKTAVIQDVKKAENILYYRGEHTAYGSFLSAPLKLKDGKVLGVLNIHKNDTNAFSKNDEIFFNAIARNVAQTIERLKICENLQRMSMHDDLTDLYTRRYFFETSKRECNSAKRYNKIFSLIMLDVDCFKYFNDAHGHRIGDEILKKIAWCLKTTVRQIDVVARYGGEEFTILLPGTDKEGATIIAEKIRALVEKDSGIMTDTNTYIEGITITAGVATYPDDGEELEEILEKADKYLYLGKAGGRNRVVNSALDAASSAQSEKRLIHRQAVALKSVINAKMYPLFFEMKINNDGWKICSLRDISKSGLRGELEYEVKTLGVYECQAILHAEVDKVIPFTIRITHKEKTFHNRYQFGAQVIKHRSSWNKLYSLITH